MSGQRHKKMGVLASANTVVLAKQHTQRRIALLVIGIVVVIVGSVLLRTQTDLFSSSTKTAVQQDYSQFIQQATQLLAPEKVEELGKLVEQVKTTQDYAKNTDVMYVIVVYYINVANETEAKAALATLRTVYKVDVGYGKELLKVQPLTLDQLEARIAFMVSQIQQFKANTILMPLEPPQ